jgi:hypothetical protein
LTGYEQVRSVAAAIAGDFASRDAGQLALPETGVCDVPRPSHMSAIGADTKDRCGGPAPKEMDVCCVADAEAKAVGKGECGCGVAT